MRTGGCGYRLRRGGSGEREQETQNDDEKRQDWVSINPSDDISVQGLGMKIEYFRHTVCGIRDFSHYKTLFELIILQLNPTFKIRKQFYPAKLILLVAMLLLQWL